VLRFKKLAELPFDSVRKCMSVVVREMDSDPESIHVLTKGAESAILPASADGPVDATRSAVDQFASEGLRTLVFAHKKISKEKFDDFAASLAVAKFSIVNRFRCETIFFLIWPIPLHISHFT
jgi:phospholipid-translocating ATPase